MIYRYHGFSDWETRALEIDDIRENHTFGFELEVQRDYNCTLSCSELSDIITNKYDDLFIFERDGSIGDGIEIISQPMTWNYFKVNIDIFKDLLKTLREYGFRSHNGNCCGLHIHVGKTALGLTNNEREYYDELLWSDKAIFKKNANKTEQVIINIQYILERFQNELYAFSRRTNYEYSRPLTEIKRLNNGTETIEKSAIKIDTHEILQNAGDRYTNLNLNNMNTIEFRMFRGTLKWSTFYFSLNMIKNIIEMAKISHNIVSWENIAFRGLTEEEKEQCKAYCEERNIDISSNSFVQLDSVKIQRISTTSKKELYEKIMNEID